MKVISRIMYGLFAAVLILSALLFVVPATPFAGHFDVKIVKSGSMEPSIMTGGVVVVRQSAAYAEGDVITFTSPGSVIPTTHRIVGTEEANGATQFVTKGDANEERDTETVSRDAVLGKVLFDVPYLGFILDFARQPLGFFLLIGIPALLIVFDELEKIWRELGRLRRKKVKDLRQTIAPLIVEPYVPPPFRVRMMDINRPIMVATGAVQPDRAPSAKREVRPPLRTNMHWAIAAGSSLMIAALVTGFSTIDSTISYFSDSERAAENALEAGVLDFTVKPDSTAFTFVGGVLLNDLDGGLITDVSPVLGGVPVLYDLTIENISEVAVCEAVVATIAGPFSYSGPLTALAASAVSATGPWTMLLGLAPGTYSLGDTCSLEMVYRGWNAEYPAPAGGYLDEERVQLTFTVASVTAPAPLGALEMQSMMLLEGTDSETDAPGEEPNHGEPVREGEKTSEQAQEVLNEIHDETEETSEQSVGESAIDTQAIIEEPEAIEEEDVVAEDETPEPEEATDAADTAATTDVSPI